MDIEFGNGNNAKFSNQTYTLGGQSLNLTTLTMKLCRWSLPIGAISNALFVLGDTAYIGLFSSDFTKTNYFNLEQSDGSMLATGATEWIFMELQ